MISLPLCPFFFNFIITPISFPLSVLLFRWYCPPAEKSGNLPAFQLKHLDNLKFKNMDKVSDSSSSDFKDEGFKYQH